MTWLSLLIKRLRLFSDTKQEKPSHPIISNAFLRVAVLKAQADFWSSLTIDFNEAFSLRTLQLYTVLLKKLSLCVRDAKHIQVLCRVWYEFTVSSYCGLAK